MRAEKQLTKKVRIKKEPNAHQYKSNKKMIKTVNAILKPIKGQKVNRWDRYHKELKT